MRLRSQFAPFALFAAAVACGSVPDETKPPPDGRLFPPRGIIRGTVVYSGPHPCSRSGHIVGNALVLVFDRRNPPPPAGLANTAVNFGVVTGDELFANEPRSSDADSAHCPADYGATDTVTASAPFTIGPLDGASYMLASFFDYTGDFLPTFKFRNLPEQGDIAGGDIDTAEALLQQTNPNYQPHFLQVDVGIAQPLDTSVPLPPHPIPNFTIPDTGFVADNVTITIAAKLAQTRPYFYPQGLAVSFDKSSNASAQNISTSVVQSSDKPPTDQRAIGGYLEVDDTTEDHNLHYAPVLTIPQDLTVLAKPTNKFAPENVNNFEAAFPHLKLMGNLPTTPTEAPVAMDPAGVFHFQLEKPDTGGSFLVWQNAPFDAKTKTYTPQIIPEGDLPYLWPLVVLNKIVDDPDHSKDPASLTAQGSPTDPVVVLQAITLLGDTQQGKESVFTTAFIETTSPDTLFDTKTQMPTIFKQDHVTVLLRPSVICFDTLFDATNPDKRGTLVTPALIGTTADLDCSQSPCKPAGTPNTPIVPPDLVKNDQIAALVKDVKQACLPTGRYAINVVYPDGQAWTVPNEAGACSASEGKTDYATLKCTSKARGTDPNRPDILYSQGTRAVVEIVAGKNCPAPVPDVCLPCCQRQNPDPSCNCQP